MKEKVAEFINLIFGLRKFILMLLLFVVGVVFRIKNLLSGSEFVDLFKSTTIAFFSANGAEHIMTTVKQYISMKAGQQASSSVSESVVPTEEIEPEGSVGADEAKAEAAASKG